MRFLISRNLLGKTFVYAALENQKENYVNELLLFETMRGRGRERRRRDGDGKQRVRGRPICEAVNSEAIKRVATPQLP